MCFIQRMLAAIPLLGLTSLLSVGCEMFEKDEQTEDESQEQGVPTGSGSAAVSDGGGFAVQPPVDLSNEGLTSSMQWRLIAKLEELQSATKFVSEDQQSAAVGSALALLGGQDQGGEEEKINFDEKFSKFVAGVKSLLNEKIIIEANIVDRLDDSVTYKIDSQSFCADQDEQPAADTEEATRRQADIDDCVKLITTLEAKVKFSSPDADTVVVEPLIGPDAVAIARFYASSSELGLTINPSAMRDFIVILDATSGDSSKVSFETPWSGDLTARLSKIDAGKYALRFESLTGVTAAGLIINKKMNVMLAPAPNLATIVVDSGNRTVSVTVDFAGLDVAIPMELIVKQDGITDEQKAQMESLELHLEAVSGNLQVDPKNSSAVLTDLTVSANPYSLSHNGKSIVEVSFPKIKTISAVLQGIAETDRLEFSTGFMVSVKMKFLELKNLVAEVPTDFLDETLSVELTGTTPVLIGRDNFLEVNSGSLTVSSSSMNKTVSVNGGQCLEIKDADNTPWIDDLIVSTCAN